MKTTLGIPDAVFRKAKAKAAERGIPLWQFITEAVEAKLGNPPATEEKPWKRGFGTLLHLRKEMARIQELIDEEFETIDPI